MRDPARIDEAIEVLRAVWIANPDLRLGQLISNAGAKAAEGSRDPYNVEDAAMVAALRTFHADYR